MEKRVFTSTEEIPEELLKRVEENITNPLGNNFVIHNLPPELTGGIMARYSRAKTGLVLTLVNEFLDESGKPSQEKGAKLMDRVLNAFGDESVGELEGTHVGIENVSHLLTKEIEDRRIGGSPIEQSTRYVAYDQKDKEGRWGFLRPKEISSIGLIDKFEKVNNKAFEVYSEGVKRLTEFFKNEFPQEKFEIKVNRDGTIASVGKKDLVNETEAREFRNAYNFTVRCAALDVGRCVLPASTLTHCGIYGNGRYFTTLLTFLKSNELQEAQERARDLEIELGKVIPTYIKRNRRDLRFSRIKENMSKLSKELFKSIIPSGEEANLLKRSDLLNEVLSSALFPYTNISLEQILNIVEKLPEDKKLEILSAYRGERDTRRDRNGRGLEAGYPLTFDLISTFAEYRDLERHRMLTQQRQLLSPDLGFVMPPEIGIINLETEVKEVVDRISELYYDLKSQELDEAAQYATLFNHKIRFMLGMNLREFQHLAELRTQQSGHFGYRGKVMEMAKKVSEKYPWAKEFYEFVDYSDPGNKISRAKEQARIAGKNILQDIDGRV